LEAQRQKGGMTVLLILGVKSGNFLGFFAIFVAFCWLVGFV
jgi:hypothetical protein